MATREPAPRSILIEKMRARGIRVTSPRRAIVRVLEEANDHLDVEEITERAKKYDDSVHRATVYRTLGLLKELHLVDELDLLHMRGDRHYYEVRAGGQHAHVICTSCGKIVEPSPEILANCMKQLADATGHSIQFCRLEAGGNCPECVARAEARRESR